AAALPAQVESGQPGLLEDDLAQEASEEVALAGGVLRGQQLALEAESPRERAHHAVDRAALLRATREVDAADDQLGLELRGRAGRAEGAAAPRALARGGGGRRRAPRAPPLPEPLRQPVVQALLEPLELGREWLGVEPFLSVRQREAPRLRAFFLAVIREELAE